MTTNQEGDQRVRALDSTHSHRMRWRYRRGLSAALVCCLLTGLRMTWAYAQEGPWTPPIFLSQDILDESGALANSAFPVLVADDWGNVHAFWPSQFHEQTGMIGDTVYYAHWNGTEWSAPLDIIYMSGDRTIGPQVAADSQGWLHLVWKSNDYVWYSRAPIVEAGLARAWSTPLHVSGGPAACAAIATGADGVVHIIYCAQEENPTLYHISSADGQEWPSPVQIESGNNPNQARIALDGRARLHVAFQSGDLANAAVYYTRSDDGGQSWLLPLQVDQVDGRYEGPYAPNAMTVAAVSDDEVHLVWLGPPRAQRWHQWSADGGATWSSAAPISTDLRLSTWPSSMVKDNLGRLHLVTLGMGNSSTLPFCLYHTYWYGGQWSPLVCIVDWGDQRTDLAITQGNILHVIWDQNSDEGRFSIWASRLEVNAPPLIQKSLPSNPPASTPTTTPATPTPSATAIPTSQPTILNPPGNIGVATPYPSEGGLWMTIWAGVLPVVLLTSIVLLVRLRNRRRSGS